MIEKIITTSDVGTGQISLGAPAEVIRAVESLLDARNMAHTPTNICAILFGLAIAELEFAKKFEQ